MIPTAKEFYDAHYSDDTVVIMRDYAEILTNKMYSDEEVFELCKQFATFIQQKRPSYKKQQEWFEQFKKK